MNPNRPGLQGSRTALCSHIFRLLRKNRAPWVLLENVPGLQMCHLTVDPPQEPAIAHVVHELESLGYSWAHRIISLSAFGLPQRRHRVFIVATLHGDPRDVLLSTESICKGQCINLSKAESKEKSPAECYECFMTPPHVTPTISVTCVDLAEKRYGPVAHEICTLTASNGRRLCMVEDLGDGRGHAFRLEIEDAERLNGFPVGWTESCYPLMIPGRPWMKAVDSHRSCIKRIELLGRAVAIPQARWIGQRLMSPYEIKFSRESDGINFSEPVPGLSSFTKEDSGTEAKLRAWPLAAWNILSSPENIQLCSKYDQAASLWRSRRGLKRMSNTPEIFSFIPLGEFLSSQRQNIDAEKLLDFKVRAEKSNIELASFITAAFGMQPRGKRKGKQSEQVKTKLDTERAGGECAGELVWISTKVSKRECFWPGIALRLDRDRDVIPSYAIEKIKSNQSSSSHRMVVYFAEESYEWLRSDRMLPFREHFDEFERQPLLVSRAKYQRAVELALEWQMHQDSSVEKLHDVHLREARAKEVEKLHQKIGNLSDTPNISCGICIICQSRKNDLDVTPSSKSSNLRASTRQRRTSPLKGVQAGQSCPQLRVSLSP